MTGSGEEDRARLERANRQLSERVWELEQQANRLTMLYVASQSLHETLQRPHVLAKIGEIIVNLLGCEEYAIFERDGLGGPLRLLASTGVDPEPLRTLALGQGAIGRASSTGRLLRADLEAPVAGLLPFEQELTACIPLVAGALPVGAIALFSLLPQKLAIEAHDVEIFELLARQGGAALHASRLLEPERVRAR